MGKVSTRVLLPDGRVTFHRHAEVGARMFGAIARRLGFERAERQRIAGLILHHLRANAYEPAWTDAAVRRFDHEMGDLLDDLIDLSRADVTSARPGRRQEAARNIDALLQRIARRARPRRARAAAPAGSGRRHHGGLPSAAVAAGRRATQAMRGGDRGAASSPSANRRPTTSSSCAAKARAARPRFRTGQGGGIVGKKKRSRATEHLRTPPGPEGSNGSLSTGCSGPLLPA